MNVNAGTVLSKCLLNVLLCVLLTCDSVPMTLRTGGICE